MLCRQACICMALCDCAMLLLMQKLALAGIPATIDVQGFLLVYHRSSNEHSDHALPYECRLASKELTHCNNSGNAQCCCSLSMLCWQACTCTAFKTVQCTADAENLPFLDFLHYFLQLLMLKAYCWCTTVAALSTAKAYCHMYANCQQSYHIAVTTVILLSAVAACQCFAGKPAYVWHCVTQHCHC